MSNNEAPDNVEPIRPPSMRQIRITAWPHRRGIFSFQMFEVDDDTGEYNLVRRGQGDSTTMFLVHLADWLKELWSTDHE